MTCACEEYSQQTGGFAPCGFHVLRTREAFEVEVRSICKRWLRDYGQDAVPWVGRLMDVEP